MAITIASVALAASACQGNGSSPTPSKPKSSACASAGQILKIGEIPASDDIGVRMTLRTARADCRGSKTITVPGDVWINSPHCDIGKIWPTCQHYGEGTPGIREPTFNN